MNDTTQSELVRQKVREGYGKIATTAGSCCGSGVSCCGSNAEASEQLVRHIGYTPEDLAQLPDGANMGLSCGNPTALATLKPGDVVLDLGAGGGFDVFIAGQRVGGSGRAIGVDMTVEMITKARKNAAIYTERTKLQNVEFRLGEIEHLPVSDACVDVVISNCVLNLSPNKPQVWREISRVLKPGGRVAISDLALLKPLPREIQELVEALVGCVAGAVLVSETERMACEAGLINIVLTPKADYVKAMTDWNDPLYKKILEHLPKDATPSDYITSLEVTATKAQDESLMSASVTELVAIGAAIAANCEPCFKYHYDKARKLGVTKQDMEQAVRTAQSVKEAPAKSVLALAERFLEGDFQARPESACCPGDAKKPTKTSCCS